MNFSKMESWNQIGSWLLIFCLIFQSCCVFTYGLTFEEKDIKPTSNLDAIMKTEGAQVNLFRILNTLMAITFFVVIVLLIFLWMVRRDFAKCEERDKKEDSSGWRLVLADVFRTPSNPSLLCVMVGNGIQILGMTIVSFIFAALGGFTSLVSRQTLIMGMFLFYMIVSVAAGFVAVRLWRTFNQKGWISVAFKTTCFFNFSFFMLTFLHFVLWGIPNSLSFIVIPTFIWFCISVPLTLVGGYFGAKAPFIQIPIETNAHPHNIPDPDGGLLIWVVVNIMCSTSSTIFFALDIVKPILTTSHVYYGIGFLFVVLILIVVICAEASLVVTYFNLRERDWAWWWKSFFAPSFVGIYISVLFIAYPNLGGVKSSSDLMFRIGLLFFWLGYSLLFVLAIMLASGTIGFFASFYFVYHLYDAYMLEQTKSQDGSKMR